MRPSAFGELVWIVLKMFMSTRNMVTSNVILPGITSGLTKKDIHETTTNRPKIEMGPSFKYLLLCKKI